MGKNVRMELDFAQEAENQKRCADIFKGHERVEVPKVYETWSTSKVLTMDFEDGFPLYAKSTLLKNGVSIEDLSDLIASTFYTMIFKDGFIHADPHPANMLVKSNGKLVLLDHGLYRPLTDKFRLAYSKLWLAIIRYDIPEIEKLCHELEVHDHWHFFVSMITLKPWENKDKVRLSKKKSTQKDNQRLIRKYFLEISNVLSTMPKEMALIFKTRDQLQALDKRLGVKRDEHYQDRLITRFCLGAVEDEEIVEAQSAYKRFFLSLKWFFVRWFADMKFALLPWAESLGFIED